VGGGAGPYAPAPELHLWLVGKRVFDFLLVLIEHISLTFPRLRARHYERISVEIVMFERGWVTERKFQGERGVAHHATTVGV